MSDHVKLALTVRMMADDGGAESTPERAVLVTTADLGVFFGYARQVDGPTIHLSRARNYLYWPSSDRGFLGLASMGPLEGRLGEFGPCAWAMAITGMGPGEYWGRWSAKADRVVIHGTKRKGRQRQVPRVADVAPARRNAVAFAHALKAASEGTVTPYDLRRTFATWMEEVGIPRTRRRLYMGHGAKDVTDLYEHADVERFLGEDGAKLRAWVGDRAPSARLRLA